MNIMMAESSRKPIEFQQKWIVRYGVRVSARDSDTGKVCSVECRFCRFFGRRDRCSPGEKHKRTTPHKKMFKVPWRSGHIVSHLTDQHTEQFKTYSALTDEQKKVFFDEPSSLPDLTSAYTSSKNADTSTSKRFFRRPIATDTALNVFVYKSIVEGIIGDLLFDPDPSSIVG